MATTTLSVKYRPIKIGFLVRDGSIEDLVKAAGINTLLWGGIHNPIIPISATSKDFSNQLLKLFSVDVLFAVSHTPEIDEIIKNNPFLRNPGHYAENIFYEDWHTKKNILGYLDSINIVDYYWEKEFKNKPKRYKSNCALVKWGSTDICNNLFSVLFGYFPTPYNLKDDFQNAFLKGLRSNEINIAQSGSLDKKLAKSITPITATTLELDGYGGTWRENGLYVGSESNFSDLLCFWNLRASGLTLEFLPKDHVGRFEDFIKTYIQRLDDAPNRNPNIEDWINIYYRGDHKDIQDIIKSFQGNKRFTFSHCDEVIWNGLNIKPASFYFDWQQVLASVEKNYDKYSVSGVLPEKKFLSTDRARRDRNVDSQHLAVSIDPIGEFGYPEHTLQPPFIRELNEFYSREIEFCPWRVRSEWEGIGVIIKANDNSLSLYPIPHHRLIEKILVKDFEGFWRCPYCEHQQYMPACIADNFKRRQNTYWNFKKSGLFARDNNQEGAIPVITSLLTFARIFDSHKLIYSTSLNLQNSKKCEIDFCILQYERGDKIQLGVAECKSEGQKINQQDIDNLKQVQDDINKLGIDCYIIFSKTVDKYEADEIELFKSLKNENRKFVILSNKELEPYHPYWEMDETDKLPEKYALDMMGMYRNSLFLYLNENN